MQTREQPNQVFTKVRNHYPVYGYGIKVPPVLGYFGAGTKYWRRAYIPVPALDKSFLVRIKCILNLCRMAVFLFLVFLDFWSEPFVFNRQ